MPILVATVLLALLVCAVGTLVYWCVVLYHVIRTRSALPTARDGAKLPEARAMLDDPAHAPRVCIVVPAHNERENIGSFVDSALAQSYPHLGVVLCLDRCTDDTLDIAARHGSRAGTLDPRLDLRVITSCPADWAGKVHAIHRGVTDSPLAQSADILLFADADTTMDKDLVVASVALMRTRRLGMLSLLSTMTHGRWFEDMVQPAAGMELMRQYPIRRANLDQGRRAFANGQFIMLTREAYTTLGGHEAVREAVLEDMEIARRCERLNIRAGLLIADGMHVCRMYATWEQFVRGWKRIYTECGNRRPSRLRKCAWYARTTGTLLPAGALACTLVGAALALTSAHPLALPMLAVGAAAIVMMLISLAACYALGNVPLRHIISYPIGAWRTGTILLLAARDLDNNVPTVWGGREYVRPAR